MAKHRDMRGSVPYGFRRKGGRLVKVNDEIETIHHIYDMWRMPGTTPSAIASALNRDQDGVRPSSGGRWTDAEVRDILSDPIYRTITHPETSDLQEERLKRTNR